MRFSFYAFSAALAVLVMASASCRRGQNEDRAPASPVSAGSVSSGSTARPAPVADSNLVVAARALRDAETQWLAASPDAAAALQRQSAAQAAYEDMIGKLGLYTGPAQDRDAKMRELVDVREKGDAARIAQAEKELAAANTKAEQGAAQARLGNPRIQQAYDELQAARKAFTALRNQEKAISKASDELTILMRKRNHLDEDRNAAVKEN